MAERIAKSLDVLRTTVNTRHPLRNKGSDGWIGDKAHRVRASDHNPDSRGVVHALDITHDIDKRGDDFDAWRFAEILRLNRDPRVSYVISNGRIFSSFDKVSGGKVVRKKWEWGPYTGSNKHAVHTHISCVSGPLEDDTRPWVIDALPSGSVTEPKPVVVPPPGITADMRARMGQKIVGYEARRDKNGHIAVFIAPDGRGEIAGITQKDHPAKYAELRSLLDAGNHTEVERRAAQYMLDYSKIVTGWVTDAGLEFFVRDSIVNRGQTGGAMILQMALGFTGREVDGEIGPASRQRLAATPAPELLDKLRTAREKYEDWKYPARRSSNQWKGMLNRWNNALAEAKKFQAEGAPSLVVKKTVAGTVATAGPAGAAAANEAGWSGWTIAGIAIIFLCAALVIWKLWPRAERSSLT